MAIAETANLVADLQLKDHLSAPAKSAKQSLNELDQATTNTSARVSHLGAATARMSGGLAHFKDRVGNLTKNIGILGLGGATLALTKFLKDSYGDAMAMGDAVERMALLTGMATGRTSRFVDALGYYGIGADKAQSITGMYLKNIDALTASKKAATKFEEEYGFKLRDSTGHVKDAEEVITSFTRFFNDKSIPASQRAAAGAKLFGRAWQDLLPIFQSGGKEWRKQLEAGFELTKEDIANMKKARQATRDWEDALGDFKVMVGVQLMPVMAELAKSAAAWLNDPSNQKTLLGFLKQGIQLGKDFAAFLGGTVIPTLSNLAGAGKQFWDALPGPLRDLLVTGLVADRTVKYLFGFSVTGVATDVIGSVVKEGLGGILGKLGLTRGSSPANPMYVTGTGLGGGGGMGPGGAGGGGGKMGWLKGAAGAMAGMVGFALGDMLADAGSNGPSAGTTEGGGMRVAGSLSKILGALAMGGPIAGAVMLAVETFNTGLETLKVVDKSQSELQQKADAAAQQSSEEALSNLKGMNRKLNDLQGLDRILGDTFGGKQQADALENLSHAIASNGKLSAGQITDAIATLKEAQRQALARGNQKVADSIGQDIAKLEKRTTAESNQTQRSTDRLRSSMASQLSKQTGVLTDIRNQPTKISVTVPVSTSVSVRDVETSTHTSSRYGFVAS